MLRGARTVQAAADLRPAQLRGVLPFEAGDELVLFVPPNETSITLNHSARAVWELCDGQRTVSDIAQALRQRYEVANGDLEADVVMALNQLQKLNLLEKRPDVADAKRAVIKFVVGIEDTPYFHWQLPILFESMYKQLPVGWELCAVVCNNHAPLSDALLRIFKTYGVRYFTGADRPSNHDMDFAAGGDRYVPLNRIEALNVIAHHVADDDVVCLMDTDMFLYGDLDPSRFPRQNAVARNWIVERDRFFTFNGEAKGVNLPTLLQSFGCRQPFKPGGVMVFLTGQTLKHKKFIQDCFRFTQLLYLLGKVAEVDKVWVSEMACVTLALTANGLAYQVLDEPTFSSQYHDAADIPDGTFYHYYHDRNDGGDGAFHRSAWHKQLFRTDNFLQADLEHYESDSVTGHEQYFFALARRAQQRLGYAVQEFVTA